MTWTGLLTSLAGVLVAWAVVIDNRHKVDATTPVVLPKWLVRGLDRLRGRERGSRLRLSQAWGYGREAIDWAAAEGPEGTQDAAALRDRLDALTEIARKLDRAAIADFEHHGFVHEALGKRIDDGRRQAVDLTTGSARVELAGLGLVFIGLVLTTLPVLM